MFNVWQSVKVTNKKNPRFGEAGTVFAVNEIEHPGEVVVLFDSDSTKVAVPVNDLTML